MGRREITFRFEDVVIMWKGNTGRVVAYRLRVEK